MSRGDVMRARDVADMLGLSVGTIYSWARQRHLPCRRRGHTVLFLRSEIQRWIDDPDSDF